MAIEVTTTVITNIERTTAISGGVVTGENSGEYIPLVDLLMHSKFQQLNVSRQTITSSIKTPSILKPFQLFQDDKQANKPFILYPTRMLICEDMYEIELVEYNNTDVINLT